MIEILTKIDRKRKFLLLLKLLQAKKKPKKKTKTKTKTKTKKPKQKLTIQTIEANNKQTLAAHIGHNYRVYTRTHWQYSQSQYSVCVLCARLQIWKERNFSWHASSSKKVSLQ